MTGDRIDTSVHSDEDMYEFEKTHPETLSPVRNVDLRVVELGEQHGVQTYIVVPPLICMSFSSPKDLLRPKVE